MEPERLRRLAEIEDWHFWFAGRRELVDRLVSAELAGGRRDVLDVGCGTGSTLARYAADHRATGVDASPEAVAAARARVPRATVDRAEAESLPFADESFDVVFLLDVLEHADDRAALAEVARVLRAAACAVASVPAMPALWSYRDAGAGHLRRYTRASVGALADSAGLELEALRPYQFALSPVVAVTRLLGRGGPRLRDLEDRPPRAVNAALRALNVAEARIGARVPLPFGTSLVARLRKPLPA